jgi:hypothetical protein
MATEPFTRSISNEDRPDRYKKYLCSFLASLMHSEITTLRLPMLAINPVSEGEYLQLLVLAQNEYLYECDPREVTETLSILDRQEAAEGVPMLIDAIDAKCSGLKTLQIMKFSDPKMEIIKDSLFDSPAFFRVLSRLTSLDLDCYDCHDWALEQIGTHATNLV